MKLLFFGMEREVLRDFLEVPQDLLGSLSQLLLVELSDKKLPVTA